MSKLRIGQGYDVHRFSPERRLVLGGVEIDYQYGLLGHSDADVLLHALMDALLGAMALGDIGKHFPDTDKLYENISSLELLSKVYSMMCAGGYELVNLDATVVLERPKISNFIPDMVKNIAAALKTAPENVSVKATTEEGLGFTGMGEGAAAYAVALIEKK